MQLDLQDCELRLADSVPVRLRRARGLIVCCTSGRVWLTVSGEPGDVILTAGEEHRIPGNGLALIEAIGAGQVRLQPATTPFQRLHIGLASLVAYITKQRPARAVVGNPSSGKALRGLCGKA